jgi:hypothetical protein
MLGKLQTPRQFDGHDERTFLTRVTSPRDKSTLRGRRGIMLPLHCKNQRTKPSACVVAQNQRRRQRHEAVPLGDKRDRQHLVWGLQLASEADIT